MDQYNKIHIIDGCEGRRAEIARSFYGIGYQPEIYDSLDEFSAHVRSEGIIFAHGKLDISLINDALRCNDVSAGYFPVVIYSDDPSLESATAAMLAGAVDYLEWPISDVDFRRKVDDIQMRSRAWHAESARRSEARALVKNLSPREEQVMRLLIEGRSNKEIAKALGISPRTVEIHRANAMRKIQANSTADAVRIGLYSGLDRPPLLDAA